MELAEEIRGARVGLNPPKPPPQQGPRGKRGESDSGQGFLLLQPEEGLHRRRRGSFGQVLFKENCLGVVPLRPAWKECDGSLRRERGDESCPRSPCPPRRRSETGEGDSTPGSVKSLLLREKSARTAPREDRMHYAPPPPPQCIRRTRG